MHKKIQGGLGHRLVRPAILLVVLATLSATVLADPPARVGRLNYITGGVSIRPGDVDEWSAATVNYPLGAGDQVYTDSDARAELHIGSIVARMAPRTAIGFLNLDDRTAQIQLLDGALHVHIRDLSGDSVFEVDTPLGAVSLLGAGDYRIDVLNEGSRLVATVRHGEAQVDLEGNSLAIHASESAIISGAQGVISYDIRDPHTMDSWDQWCAGRDGREEQVTSVKYVSRETLGYEDLDTYGNWRRDPAYGVVWIPSGVIEGWAPYRNGRWAWKEPWGWTWIDDSSWGFAPFHYGRWAFTNGYWAWLPGKLVARPVYAPALVVFAGGDPGWGGSFLGRGVSGIGWFPLGPHEIYYPGYRASAGYIREINSSHVNEAELNLTDYRVASARYVNQSVGGACTAVPRDSFLAGRSLRGAVAVPDSALTGIKTIGPTAAVSPSRVSALSGPITGSQVPRPSSVLLKRAVVARTAPPPAPVSFALREKALAANPGRPLDAAALATLRKSANSTAQARVKSASASTGIAIKPVRYGITATQTTTGSVSANGGSPKEAEAKAAVNEKTGGAAHSRTRKGSPKNANATGSIGGAKSSNANRGTTTGNSRKAAKAATKNANSGHVAGQEKKRAGNTNRNARSRNAGGPGNGNKSRSIGSNSNRPRPSNHAARSNSNRTGSRNSNRKGNTGGSHVNRQGNATSRNSKAATRVTVANKSGNRSGSNSRGNRGAASTARSANKTRTGGSANSNSVHK